MCRNWAVHDSRNDAPVLRAQLNRPNLISASTYGLAHVKARRIGADVVDPKKLKAQRPLGDLVTSA